MMTEYTFDDAVPVPVTTVRQGSNIAMLKQMKIGQSYWWSAADAKKATRFYRVAKKLGLGIIIRKVDANDKRGEGIRMWRIEKDEVDPIAVAAQQAAAALEPAPVKKPAKKATAKKNAAPVKKAKKLATEIPSTPAYTKKQLAALAAAAK